MYRISAAYMAIVCVLAVLLEAGFREAFDLFMGEQAPFLSLLAGMVFAAALGAGAVRLLRRVDRHVWHHWDDEEPRPAAEPAPSPSPAASQDEELTAKESLLAEAAQQPSSLAADVTRVLASAAARADKAGHASRALMAPLARCRELMDECSVSLGNLAQAMDRVRAQSAKASSKLSVISDAAGEAQSLVEDMASIAEQTDMLSVNASIEAEKAGEHGRGFSVVAREVRRLADTAQSSAQDIELLVARMRQAVASEVMEMDSFNREAVTGDARLKELSLAVREAAGALQAVEGSLQAASGLAGGVGPALAEALALARDLKGSLGELKDLASGGTSDTGPDGQPTA